MGLENGALAMESTGASVCSSEESATNDRN